MVFMEPGILPTFQFSSYFMVFDLNIQRSRPRYIWEHPAGLQEVSVAFQISLCTVLRKHLCWRDFSTARENLFSSFSLYFTRLFVTEIFLCYFC